MPVPRIERIEPEDIPRPHPKPLAVRLTPTGERAVRSGHPWVFDSSVRSRSREGSPGDVAVVFDRKDRFLAVGLYDPESPIRVRVLRWGSPAPVGEALFADILRASVGRRSELQARNDTTGYRLVHGESDGLPGLVLDRYGEYAVLELHTAAWLPRLRELLPCIAEVVGPRALVGLVSRRVAQHPYCPDQLRKGALLLGSLESRALPFLESGLRFEAHPLEGQKTGFYLDQRENRGRVESLAGGATVLNVFSYSGGFSLYAARGGAPEVLSVDASGPALSQAVRHFELNHEAVRSVRHDVRQGDAFEVMGALAAERRRFGMVIVDPPSFAKEARQRAGALDAYAVLTRLALRLLEEGGILVQASCSSRIAAEELFARIHSTARAQGRRLEEIERTGQPSDHPADFPEAAYLKCLFARVG